MKVLMINGSPRKNGNTNRAFLEMKKIFDAEGVETEIYQLGNSVVRGCSACGACKKLGKCVYDDDDVNMLAEKLREADGLVIGSPTYYASMNGSLVSLLDRLYYSGGIDFVGKVGASVIIARRGGATAAWDQVNKYLAYGGMALATSSSYWSIGYGREPGEVEEDREGISTFRNLAINMVFLMKSIALGKTRYGLPKQEEKAWTHFIR